MTFVCVVFAVIVYVYEHLLTSQHPRFDDEYKKTRVLNEMLEMNEIVNTCLEFVVPINLPAMMCVSVRQQ